MWIYRLLKFEKNEPVDTVLERYRGMGPGFDLLRILLAVAIFYGHTKWIAGESGMALQAIAEGAAHQGARAAEIATTTAASQEWTGITRPLKLALVPMFFALSGFLVTGSAMRLRATSTFLAHRGLRIFPALIVEVTLAALILGPLLTTLTLSAYFAGPDFFRYFGNILGLVWFNLPGLFESNPVPNTVNVNLWTLPSEFYCYLLMALAMLTRIVYNRKYVTILFVAVTIGLSVAHFMTDISRPIGPYPAHVIVYYFFVGVIFFHWKDKIPANIWIFLAAGILSYVSLFYVEFTYLTPFVLVYATIFCGLVPIPKLPLLQSGDYSYGIYLYGFPIAQALVAIFPALFIGNSILLIPVSLAVTMLFSVFSWHFIEKHALASKQHLPQRWFPTPSGGKAKAAASSTPVSKQGG